jgi:hypothetical protein
VSQAVPIRPEEYAVAVVQGEHVTASVLFEPWTFGRDPLDRGRPVKKSGQDHESGLRTHSASVTDSSRRPKRGEASMTAREVRAARAGGGSWRPRCAGALVAALVFAGWADSSSGAGVSGYREVAPLGAGRYSTIVDATVGADGALWLVAIKSGGQLVRVDRRGGISTYSPEQSLGLARPSSSAIVSGPGRRLWIFTVDTTRQDNGGQMLDAVGTDGQLKQAVPVPARLYEGFFPTPMVASSAGAIWLPYGPTEAQPLHGFMGLQPGDGSVTDFPTLQTPDLFGGDGGYASGVEPVSGGTDDFFVLENVFGRRAAVWRITPSGPSEGRRIADLSGRGAALARDTRGGVWVSTLTSVPGGLGSVTGQVRRIDPVSGKATRVKGLGVVTSFAPGSGGTMWALATRCVPARLCQGGASNVDFTSVQHTVSSIGPSGRITRYVLPRRARRYRTLHIGPRRHAWVTYYKGPRTSYTTGIATFGLPPAGGDAR